MKRIIFCFILAVLICQLPAHASPIDIHLVSSSHTIWGDISYNDPDYVRIYDSYYLESSKPVSGGFDFDPVGDTSSLTSYSNTDYFYVDTSSRCYDGEAKAHAEAMTRWTFRPIDSITHTLQIELRYNWSSFHGTLKNLSSGDVLWDYEPVLYGSDFLIIDIDGYFNSIDTYELIFHTKTSSASGVDCPIISVAKASGFNIISVPEPSTLFLLGTGIVGLLRFRIKYFKE